MKKFLFQAFHAWCSLFGGDIPVRPDPFGPVEIPVLTPPAMVPDGKPPRMPPPNCDRVREYYMVLACSHGLFHEVRATAATLRRVRILGSMELIERARSNHYRAVNLYRESRARARAALAGSGYRGN